MKEIRIMYLLLIYAGAGSARTFVDQSPLGFFTQAIVSDVFDQFNTNGTYLSEIQEGPSTFDVD